MLCAPRAWHLVFAIITTYLMKGGLMSMYTEIMGEETKTQSASLKTYIVVGVVGFVLGAVARKIRDKI